jgi:hypothetical protein
MTTAECQRCCCRTRARGLAGALAGGLAGWRAGGLAGLASRLAGASLALCCCYDDSRMPTMLLSHAGAEDAVPEMSDHAETLRSWE